MSSPPDLGCLTTRYGRDAVHMAVIAVTAGADMPRAANVHVAGDGLAYETNAATRMGVADPFLPGAIAKGERFWLLITPGTITGLRHVWNHPAFPDAAAATDEEREESERYLREYIGNPEAFDVTWEQAIEDHMKGDGEVFGHEPDGPPDNEFYFHLERYTGGHAVRQDYRFSCRC